MPTGADLDMLVLDGEPEPVTSPRTRWSGLTLLVTGLLLALLAGALFAPGIDGNPTATAMPDPPAPGSCVLMGSADLSVVECSEPHNAEVTRSWAAGSMAAGAPEFAELSGYPLLPAHGGVRHESCWTAEAAYLDYGRSDPTGNWSLVQPEVISQLVAAPSGQRAADRGWTACVVGSPDRRVYNSTLRGGLRGGAPIDSEFGICYAVRPVGAVDAASCAGPHEIEVLGYFDPHSVFSESGSFVGPDTAAALAESCAGVIVDLAAAPDPTFGGRLAVRATTLVPDWTTTILTTDSTGLPTNVSLPMQFCYVQTTGPSALVGSIIGLSDRPLPLA